MKLVDLINTTMGVRLALNLAQGTPRAIGIRIVDALAAFLSRRRRTSLVQAVHLNQWIVSGKRLNYIQLARACREVFRIQGRNFYDFYHNLDRPKEVLRLVSLTENFRRIVMPRIDCGQGTMMVIPHLSNFDLAGRALALMGLRFQVLSYPITPGGYKLQNKLRSESGLEVTPMNIESMHAAKQRLKQGGLVLTGMDRPMEESKYPVRFFGYPANLPVAYIRMAMQTDSQVVVVACQSNGDGRYYLDAAEPITMETQGDMHELIVHNAEKIVAPAEEYIRQRPLQWSMFYPVWPQFLADVPRSGFQPAQETASEKV